MGLLPRAVAELVTENGISPVALAISPKGELICSFFLRTVGASMERAYPSLVLEVIMSSMQKATAPDLLWLRVGGLSSPVNGGSAYQLVTEIPDKTRDFQRRDEESEPAEAGVLESE